MGINYGQLLAMLAGTAGLAAIGGKVRANKINSYEDTMNSALPDGYKIPTKKRNFYFGDVSAQQKADDELYKSQMDKYRGDQLATHVEQHPDAYYSPQTQAPMPTYGQSLPPMNYSQATGAAGTTPVIDPATGTISTGATQQSLGYSLPRGLGLEGAKALIGLTQKGSEMGIQQQNANTQAAHLPIAQQQADATTMNANTQAASQKALDARERLKMIEQQRHDRATEQIQARNAASAEKRAQVYARTAGLHGMSQADQVLAAYKAGRVSEPEYKSWLLYHGGGDTESTTTTTDSSGNVTKTTHTHRGKSGTPGTAATGHSVDVGGGVHIKGF